MKKTIVTCALTGVLTDPKQHHVPVTPAEMAQSAKEAYDAGASVVHCHFRMQEPGMGRFPTWDPDVAAEICNAIKVKCPGIILNLTTGVLGRDISGPVACLERVRPEMAALNAGSLNYLKLKTNNDWAWSPVLFDNPVDKVKEFADKMYALGITPECECFDTGILRSVSMYKDTGILRDPVHASLIMGVASGMPARPEWLPLLVHEMRLGTHWQVIAIGRGEVWPLHRKAAELGGNLRTGLEDTFYLPNGDKATSNGQLVEAIVKIAEETGRGIASPAEARQMAGLGVFHQS